MKKLLTIATIFITLTVQSGTLTHPNNFVQPIADITDNSTLDEDSRDAIISNTVVYPNTSVSTANVFENRNYGSTNDPVLYIEHTLEDNTPELLDQYGIPIMTFADSSYYTYQSDTYILQPNQTYRDYFTINADVNQTTINYSVTTWIDGVYFDAGAPLLDHDFGNNLSTSQASFSPGFGITTGNDTVEFRFLLYGEISNYGSGGLVETTYQLTNVNNQVQFDNFFQQSTNNPVPEPTTISLLTFGLLFLGIRSRWINQG